MTQNERGRKRVPQENLPSSEGRAKRFSRVFNRRARRVSLALAAAAAFACGAGSAAAARMENPPPPAVAAAELAAAAPQKAQDDAHAQERLGRIRARMEETALGRALLQFAASENIRIEMSDSRTIDSAPDDGITIKGINYSTLIRLNGDVANDDAVLITLAHEIRHSWHERQLLSDAMPLAPRHEWLKRRIQEADAFAFQIHFAWEHEQATGKRLGLRDFAQQGCAGDNAYACLLSDYRGWRKDMDAAGAYSRLLEKTMSHVKRQSYDARIIRHLDAGWGRVAQNPALGARWAALLATPATDAQFAEQMRRVATAGLAPGTDSAALSHWTEADFLDFKKTGGTPARADRKAFEAVQKKYDAAQKAWQDFTAPPASDAQAPKPPGVS